MFWIEAPLLIGGIGVVLFLAGYGLPDRLVFDQSPPWQIVLPLRERWPTS